MAASAPKPRTRAIAAKPAATYPASPPTVSPDANSPTLPPALTLGEPYIDQSRPLQVYSQQQHTSNVLDVFHPAMMAVSASPPQIPSAAAGTFMLAPTQPLVPGGAASPAWSVSSASLNGDIVAAAPLHPATYYSPTTRSGMLFGSTAQEWLAASCSAAAAAGVSHEIMFPGLAHLPVSSAQGLLNTSSSLTTAANDAAVLDGWLQQFVNAEAIEGVDRHPRAQSMDSGEFLFGNGAICPESLTVIDTPASLELPLGSPHSVHSSPSAVTACSGIDLLNDSEVAAIASAAAGALSSDVLASMISSAANYCSPRANPSSELNMLAALPFTAIATANIAPQKTLAIAGSSESEAMPPNKKQRRPSPARKTLRQAADAENGRGYPPIRNAGSSIAPSTANTTAPAASANHSRPQPAGSSSASSSSSSSSSVSPPPPSVRAKVAATRHMVPLAPRQPSPPSENTSGAVKHSESVANTSGAQSPSSGSNTPPGLSVLAKIAQKQAPIQVKVEDPQTTQGAQSNLRPIAQACSPNSRLNCAPQSRSNCSETLEKGDCSALLMAAALSSTGSTGETVAQKRQERLIKNRAAALLSRKRKRDYMTKLESEVEELRESNMSMARRLEEMEQRLNALAAERDELRRENASAKVAAPQSSTSSATGQSAASANKESEGGKSASGDTSGNSGAESSSQAAEKPDDAMEVDGDSSGQSALSFLGTDGISAKISRLATIQPRVSLPVPKSRQPESQQQSNKQRTTGALLMAVLFSFSLFTLPSLYTSDSQIATGGSQSAGMPVHALPPSAAEQRLLISDVIEQQRVLPDEGEHVAVAGSPLLERVRRSISELAQQVDGAQAQPSNSSEASRVRPMTMEESAGLHAWIKHGLSASSSGDANSRVDGRAIGAHMEREEVLPVSSLAVVRNSPHHVNRQLDYAMLYCPSMQHVLLGGDVEDVDGSVYKPSAPRVIHGPPAVEPRTLDDVDDAVPPSVAGEQFASSRVARHGSADLLVPTQAGENLLLMHQQPRPKMSLYSPVVARGGLNADDDILAPWEEYAKVDPAVAGGRQKYLRIDVEVVGSRWVTADKFASGLY
ncbi:hypothetical protein GGH94_000171 [Coemansia aciculifera]|uniref:BZIP domain-containing protein n=1 Tax=Coemansia aciculifera TaxID=417176 RepID=A0A9W8M844_9FUNG|nr:hypothetical protein GGH94_000171 [Coemansia aciculifera]